MSALRTLDLESIAPAVLPYLSFIGTFWGGDSADEYLSAGGAVRYQARFEDYRPRRADECVRRYVFEAIRRRPLRAELRSGK
jgi:hypothetical protein